MNIEPNISTLKKQQESNFKKRGILFGLLSGLTFGLFSTFSAMAMNDSMFVGISVILVSLMVSAINDTIACLWLVLYNFSKGRIKEIGRSLLTFPGIMVVIAALIGGPIANSAYLIGIAAAGPAAIPISALCPMFGAIFAAVFLKQKIEKRVALGMLICIIGAVLISYEKPDGSGNNFTFGILCALMAALGWGLEGVFSAFGMSMIDSDVAINIREGVSGIAYLLIVLPIFKAYPMLFKVIQLPNIMAIIAIGALFASISFLSWYSANAMAGVATGMSLNITYVMWGVIFSLIFLKTSISTMGIIGTIVITIGAILVSINPLDFFKKKEVQ